ncbi:malonate transporter subunit MadL [Methylobacterium sp. Gmos1]
MLRAVRGALVERPPTTLGVSVLALCPLIGMFLGDLRQEKASGGGVGIAMMGLIAARIRRVRRW